jgi:hypothetical protein
MDASQQPIHIRLTRCTKYWRNTQDIRTQISLLLRAESIVKQRLSVTENCNGVTEFDNGEQSSKQADFNKRAPRMGFEPMRNGCSTGSQGPRVNHSATSALTIQQF